MFQNPRACKLFNSVVVSKSGDIFFTHSSSEVEIDKIIHSMAINPSGRLIQYSRSNGKITVLKDQILFANGLVLSPDEDFIIVAETGTSTLYRVWLQGDKVGSSEIFIDGLPGTPDNLTINKKGILVTMAASGDPYHPIASHFLAPWPKIRKFIVRLCDLILMPFRFVNSIYPNVITNTFVREFGGMNSLKYIFSARRTVILLNWNGEIIASYHGSDGSLGPITHALQISDDTILTGSVTENYIGRIKIK